MHWKFPFEIPTREPLWSTNPLTKDRFLVYRKKFPFTVRVSENKYQNKVIGIFTQFFVRLYRDMTCQTDYEMCEVDKDNGIIT